MFPEDFLTFEKNYERALAADEGPEFAINAILEVVKEIKTLTGVLETEVRQRMNEVMGRRALFTTSERCSGVAPETPKEGDQVWLSSGASTPLILRNISGGKGTHHLVGEAYIGRFMHGEGVLLSTGSAVPVVIL